jgi:hypothetical protein
VHTSDSATGYMPSAPEYELSLSPPQYADISLCTGYTNKPNTRQNYKYHAPQTWDEAFNYISENKEFMNIHDDTRSASRKMSDSQSSF